MAYYEIRLHDIKDSSSHHLIFFQAWNKVFLNTSTNLNNLFYQNLFKKMLHLFHFGKFLCSQTEE